MTAGPTKAAAPSQASWSEQRTEAGAEAYDPFGLERRFRRQNYFLSVWRIGHLLWEKHVPWIPQMIRIFCQVVFHADVPVQVDIPRNVVFMHNGLGTVIHTRVKFRGPAIVYHNVTMGMSHGLNDGPPTIGKRVLIGAGAIVIGPVDVGDDCIVGANAVVTKSIPSGHMAVGNPAQIRPCNPEVLNALFSPPTGGVAESERGDYPPLEIPVDRRKIS